MDNQLATKSCLKATKGLSRYCGHIFFNFFVYIYFNWNINLMKTVRNWFPEFAWDPLVLSVEKICILTSSSGVSASTVPKPADNRWCLFNCKSHFSCLSPSLSRCSEMKSPLPTHHRLVLTCSNTSHANLPNMFFFPIINYSNRKLNSKQTEMRLKIGREKRN